MQRKIEDVEKILNTPMQENDAGAKTVRHYLFKILMGVWTENESFSGKRPFGNSGWDYEIAEPLVKHGFVEGEWSEEDQDLISVDYNSLNDCVVMCIRHLFREPNT